MACPPLLNTMKKRDAAGPPSRRSLRLAEQARQEMLRQRKIVHGGHEVGDTHEDPLLIPLDEEKEAVTLSPPKAEVNSPFNPNYDSDYQEFLTEFLADDSLGNTPPTSPLLTTPNKIFHVSSRRWPVGVSGNSGECQAVGVDREVGGRLRSLVSADLRWAVVVGGGGGQWSEWTAVKTEK
nr:uncharacterized protein LOC109166971 [Ipomoea trifida]